MRRKLYDEAKCLFGVALFPTMKIKRQYKPPKIRINICMLHPRLQCIVTNAWFVGIYIHENYHKDLNLN
jgi:hypothetical protein